MKNFSISELLERSLKLYQFNFKQLLVLGLLIGLSAFFSERVSYIFGFDPSNEIWRILFRIGLTILRIYFFVCLICQVKSAYFNETAKGLEVLKIGRSYFWSYFTTSLALGLLLLLICLPVIILWFYFESLLIYIIGFAVLIIVIIILFPMYVFAPYINVLSPEVDNPIQESARITKGERFNVFLVFLIGGLLEFSVPAISNYIVVAPFIHSVSTFLFTAILSPLTTCMTIILYYYLVKYSRSSY